jgi:tetratricopeptide (TPR) repeat protein
MSHRGVSGSRRPFLMFFLLGVALTWSLPALSQSVGADSVCTGRTSGTVAERVRACSSLIDSHTFNGDQLVILYTSRGAAWRAQGDLDRALADQNEALALKPNSAIILFNRAVTWQSKRQTEHAISDYSEAIKLAPDFAMAYKNRGDAFFAIADYDRAIADYDSALRLQPQYAEAVARRGLAKFQKGDFNQGNADIRTAHEIDPAITPVLFGPRGIVSSKGQSFMVRNDLGVFTALELNNTSICVQANLVLEQQLKKYFDNYSMKFLLRSFSSFDEARQAYDRRECNVLAANIADLRAARQNLSQPEIHHLLPEVFAVASLTETEAPPKPQPPAAARADFWDYNGSTLSLVADGNTRKFYYTEPRPVLRNMGVTPGTLLFDGIRSGYSYKGTTYVFSDHCEPLAFPISGDVSSDDRKITLVGKVPVRDSQCRVTAHRDYTMEVVFHNKADNWGAGVQ